MDRGSDRDRGAARGRITYQADDGRSRCRKFLPHAWTRADAAKAIAKCRATVGKEAGVGLLRVSYAKEISGKVELRELPGLNDQVRLRGSSTATQHHGDAAVARELRVAKGA